MEVVAWYAFRITRYSDLDIPVEEPEDLLATIEEQVFKRRFGEVVRVEVQDDMPAHLRALLLDELREDDVPEPGRLAERDIQDAGRLLDLSYLVGLYRSTFPRSRTRHSCRRCRRSCATWIAASSTSFARATCSCIIRSSLFPASVERFLEEAAADDQVLAIKLTLYRTSGDTALVRRARGRGAAGQAGGRDRRAQGAL